VSVAERLLHQAVKVLPPDLVVVAVAGILTPHMLHAGLRQRVMHGAATIDRGVLGARADEDQRAFTSIRLNQISAYSISIAIFPRVPSGPQTSSGTIRPPPTQPVNSKSGI
jgi:hypothetical protein